MNALKWSYNRLPESEKLMLVDIACVFCSWEKQKALEIWASCKKCSSCCGLGTPHTSLRHLIDKSLVLLEENGRVLAMHSLLRDMGQNIGMADGSHLWEGRTTKAIMEKDQGTNKVRALNLANSREHKFGAEIFSKMQNLHFLVLDGCDVSGDLGSISKELRWLKWRDMPSTWLSTKLELSNLVSLDFSESTKLADLWAESNPWLESLNLSACKSITELPDSIRHLLRLQTLELLACENLRMLPACIGQLSKLQTLVLIACTSLEGLPDSITALPSLRRLQMNNCSSVSKLPPTFEHMTSVDLLSIDLATECQAIGIGQFHALKELHVSGCTDEAITALDSLGTLKNLDQLFLLSIRDCMSMTKLPESIGLLTNLQELRLHYCEKLQELPNSIAQLQVLKSLELFMCSNLETLPDSLGALRSLKRLSMTWCRSLTTLPDSIKQLHALEVLYIEDCGSLEGLGALTALHGLRIWGCTSVTELRGSCLLVFDIHFSGRPVIENLPCLLMESYVLEDNDCGSLCFLQNSRGFELLLLRVHRLPCQATEASCSSLPEV